MEKPPAIVIQEALKDLLGGSIKEMMEAEISHHLGYEKWSDSDNARNGHKYKRVKSSYGNFSVEVPQDRKSTFAPQIQEWQMRPLEEVYPVVFVDATH